MRILVTGSLGFMGSHLVDYLVKKSHDVIGIDNLSTGFRTNRNPKASTFRVDLVERPELAAEIIESFKPEIVYHLAAWAHEGLSQFSPIKITENNYNAMLNVLIPSIRAGMRRFVFTSSMSVYGEQTPPFDEEMKTDPVDIYGVAKEASEKSIEILSAVHGFDYTVVRPHNVYGERQNLSDPYRNVIGIFIRRAMNGENIYIYGDGEQTRAFSYIDDVTPAIARAGFESKAIGEMINVGPIEEYSINELAQKLTKFFPTLTVKHVPDRPMEVKHAYCTNQKAIDLLGYKTKTSLEEGLYKMTDWAGYLKENGGIAPPQYLDDLELTTKDTPETWTKKTI